MRELPWLCLCVCLFEKSQKMKNDDFVTSFLSSLGPMRITTRVRLNKTWLENGIEHEQTFRWPGNEQLVSYS